MKLLVQGDDFGFTKGVTLGIIEGIENPPRNKQERYTLIAERSLAWIGKIKQECE